MHSPTIYISFRTVSKDFKGNLGTTLAVRMAGVDTGPDTHDFNDARIETKWKETF